jgi:hypothetical protein
VHVEVLLAADALELLGEGLLELLAALPEEEVLRPVARPREGPIDFDCGVITFSSIASGPPNSAMTSATALGWSSHSTDASRAMSNASALGKRITWSSRKLTWRMPTETSSTWTAYGLR